MSSSSAMARILIKGGKVVNDDCTQEADVYIENGIIQQVGKELMIPGGAKVIDASGKLVLPGGIDTSVHLEESFMNATSADDFYSGTKVTGFKPRPDSAGRSPPIPLLTLSRSSERRWVLILAKTRRRGDEASSNNLEIKMRRLFDFVPSVFHCQTCCLF